MSNRGRGGPETHAPAVFNCPTRLLLWAFFHFVHAGPVDLVHVGHDPADQRDLRCSLSLPDGLVCCCSSDCSGRSVRGHVGGRGRDEVGEWG